MTTTQLAPAPTGQEWRMGAACTTKEADWFWLESGQLSAKNRAALRLCETCPVRELCHADAVAHRDRDRRWSFIAGGEVFMGARRRGTPTKPVTAAASIKDGDR